MRRTRVAILGSTGSIGTQTLDIIRNNKERFEVYAIAANCSGNKLIEQAREFNPEVVCVADEDTYKEVKEALSDMSIKVWCGLQSIAEMVSMPSIDIVVTAMVGYAGLLPTIEAIKHSKTIALANKETLVVAGELICELVRQYNAKIIPVDSEHSAIFQSLTGEGNNEIEKIILTASGGPFRTYSTNELSKVTAAMALQHPNWTMGAKITIDSASMMNKGFEVIEAKWLFGAEAEQIQVLVHPQSIIHSAVQFTDGTIKAQLAAPDMHIPIQYALTYPERMATSYSRVDFIGIKDLTFEEPDIRRFPNLQLAYNAIKEGGNIPCALNAANEIVNLAFRESKCGFMQMPDIIAATMDKIVYIAKPSYEDYVQTDKESRQIAEELLQSKTI